MNDQPIVDAFPHWQRFAADLPADRVVWSEVLPGGAHWSWRLSRGTALRFAALDDRANCSVVLYAAHDPLERYNLPDSLKAQHTAHYTRGHTLMSDMGRALASFTHDTLGWHDPFGGLLDSARMAQKYGEHRYEVHRNAMYRSGRDGLLVEIGKHGLTARDLIAPVNLFSRVTVDANGRFVFDDQRKTAGASVELRCDMDVIVAVSTAPHPLDPRPGYQPGKVGIAAWKSGAAPADDYCRGFRPECARALHNADVFALA
ncbi:urea amidolyase associated protein UAAP1 [Piscinibacter gummiphilus]|uniref:urea amidolyase associated protein UAAP1 n=1 Tax=Piscinibacter gummiphilus TaxID=946333 RepID=UPI000A26A915|nr:urea amidolyase associated protein UAAP1 [Piscinibacter gummiphilus]ATU67544.1 urea carboxylase [Piscinibacter gummiphilus]GLS96662.1 urea carboxylase [Piscinibacter gummiphilus]